MDTLAFPFEGPAKWQAAVAGALLDVVDPEVGISIVELGLVYGVVMAGDICTVRLTMTSAACPLGDLIVGDVQAALDDVLPEHWALDVQLVWEPPWTPERMSPAARREMQW